MREKYPRIVIKPPKLSLPSHITTKIKCNFIGDTRERLYTDFYKDWWNNFTPICIIKYLTTPLCSDDNLFPPPVPPLCRSSKQNLTPPASHPTRPDNKWLFSNSQTLPNLTRRTSLEQSAFNLLRIAAIDLAFKRRLLGL